MSHRIPTTATRDSVLVAIAECDRLGEAEFLKAHGFGPSKVYRVLHAGKTYPSKAILGVASGLTAREFSGGAAHTARVLARLGFSVMQARSFATAAVLATVGAVAALWPYTAPAMPAGLPLEPVAVFASGSNDPGEIRAFSEIGHDIGVAAPHVSRNAEAALADLAGSDVQVFLDSGAFSEVKFPKNGPPVLKRPIPEKEWVKRLALAKRLAVALGDQLHFVAPDRVGSQEVTLERLTRYREQVREIAALGARVLVCVQRGALPQADFLARCQAVLGDDVTIVPALPCKKAATSPAEVAAFCAAVRPRNLHLLGVGVRNENAPAYLAAVRDNAPACQLTVDSNVLAAHTGSEGGPGGGPRRRTVARRWAERLVAVAQLAKGAIAEFAVLLAWGGRDLASQTDPMLAACAAGVGA